MIEQGQSTWEGNIVSSVHATFQLHANMGYVYRRKGFSESKARGMESENRDDSGLPTGVSYFNLVFVLESDLRSFTHFDQVLRSASFSDCI